MTYENARKFIQNAAKSGSVLGLDSIRKLMQELSDVQDTIPVIHIAGTNGKGSVGAYLASVFREAGLHVGRYCSPAVFDPLEVWQYDGRNMTKAEYAQVMSQVRDACDIVVSNGSVMPTVFEIETAAAFVYFAQKKTDILLLETGMGGETDATNVIRHPLASVITTISMDHMQFLGNSLQEIASVKAGIIKEGCPVFSAPQRAEAEAVLRNRAKEKHTEITFVDKSLLQPVREAADRLEFYYSAAPKRWAAEDENGKVVYAPTSLLFLLETSMTGGYQMKNAALAVETAIALLPKLLDDPEYGDTDQAASGKSRRTVSVMECQQKRLEWVMKGISQAKWQGRFETLGNNPLFIIDGAHNEDAAAELAKTVQNCFTNMQLTYIIGVLADKEHEKMLKLMLPHAARVYTVTPRNPRALDGRRLAEEAKRFCGNVTACRSVEEAVKLALQEKEAVLAFGSLSYLGELKEAYQRLTANRPDGR